jgi:hypothetical protein
MPFNITDYALARSADFPNLKWLHLSETQIADNGLRHLAHIALLEPVCQHQHQQRQVEAHAAVAPV